MGILGGGGSGGSEGRAWSAVVGHTGGVVIFRHSSGPFEVDGTDPRRNAL